MIWYIHIYTVKWSSQIRLINTFITPHCCCCLVTQSCPTLCDSMDCSPPGSSAHGILQARIILQWVAISFSRGSSQPRDWTRDSCVSFIASRYFTTDSPGKPINPHSNLLMVRTLKVYSLSKFHVYNIVLSTIVTMLYIRSP